MNLNDLPIVVLSRIFGFVNLRHRPQLRAVCHKWLDLIRFTDVKYLNIKSIEGHGMPFSEEKLDELLAFFAITANCDVFGLDYAKKDYQLDNKRMDFLANHCPSLERLSGDLLDVCIESVDRLKSLKELKFRSILRATGMPPDGINFLNDQLSEIEIYGLTRRDLTLLMELQTPALRTVHIWSAKQFFRNEDLARLTNRCPGITNLEIPGCEVSNVESLKGLPRLVHLSLQQCLTIADVNNGLETMMRSCPSMNFLNLAECSKLSSFGFLAFAPNLEHLDVAWTKFSEASLDHLSQSSKLGVLNLSATSAISDAGFTAIAQKRFRLQRLIAKNDLHSGNLGVSTSGVDVLLKSHGGTLEELNLAKNKNVGDAVYASILMRCKRLEDVCIVGCGLTGNGFERFVAERAKRYREGVPVAMVLIDGADLGATMYNERFDAKVCT